MTLISSIINDAFREGNILPLGKAATAAQVTEALRLLNSVFSGIFGNEAGERLQDWPLGLFGREDPSSIDISPRQIVRPPINRRLVATGLTALTVYLTEFPQDGTRMGLIDPFGRLAAFPVTLNANGRTIEGTPTLTINTDNTMSEWFFRSDLGNWVKITSTVETDHLPFPQEFDTFFITTLAMRINPRYGREMDAQSAMVYKAEKRKFVSRYLQSARLEILDDLSWPFMSTQGYDQERTFGNTSQGFGRGNPWG